MASLTYIPATCFSTIRRFIKNQAGFAATEFALIAPIMITVLLGIIEGSDALSTNRRVNLAAATLADLVAQEAQIDNDSMNDLFVGVEDVVTSEDINITFTVVSVMRDEMTGKTVVDWSYSNDPGNREPYAPGSVYAGLPNDALLSTASSLVVSETSYTYQSTFTKYVFQNDITFQKSATRWPRRSVAVTYCGATCPS